MPSYRRRGKGWEVIYDLPRTDGRRRQRTKGGFRTRGEAVEWYDNRPASERGPRDASDLTLRQYLDGWLEQRAQRVKPATVYQYQTVITHTILPLLGDVRLDQLTPAVLLDWQRAMSARLSRRTFATRRVVLSSALNDAVRAGLLDVNPLHRVPPPPTPDDPEPFPWDDLDIQAYLDAAADRPNGAVCIMAVLTGLRMGELLALTWAAVDLERGTLAVLVTDTIDRDQRRTTGPPKTRASRRRVTLPETAVRLLRDHRRAQLQDRLRAGSTWQDHDLVFCRWNGVAINRETLRDHHHQICRAAGVPRVTFHDLRHAMATWLLILGEHPKVVQERLGHRHLATTMDLYSHVTDGMQRQAAERIENALRASGVQRVSNH